MSLEFLISDASDIRDFTISDTVHVAWIFGGGEGSFFGEASAWGHALEPPGITNQELHPAQDVFHGAAHISSSS